MSDAEPQFIATIPKNANEDVRVALTEFKGKDLFDLRVFAEYDGTDGERRPTKKGVCMAIERLPDLIAGLTLAQAEAERRGLLSGG